MEARKTTVRFGAGLSSLPQAASAAQQASEACLAGIEGMGGTGGARSIDLAVLFISKHHVESARTIATVIARCLGPRCLVGVSAEAVIGGPIELEGDPAPPGISLLAASLPGTTVTTFRLENLPSPSEGAASADEHAALAAAAGMGVDYGGSVLLADPFSVPLNGLLPRMAAARPPGRSPRGRPPPIVGGLASAGARAGTNVLLLNDTITRAGGVGVSFGGSRGVRIEPLVSQGCRAIGHPFVVTGVKGQIITTLGGRPAMEAFGELFESLDESVRALAKNGLFIGRAVSEYRERFGRDDFLIRNVIGVDRGHGAMAVADLLRIGQTVQFHLRDGTTASEDLAMLLDGHSLHGPPAGVLLFTCNARGRRLFEVPNHDAAAVCRAFAPPESGERQAKGGQAIPGRSSTVPLAGFFAAGEIGPIGDGVFVHGQTACAAMFRGHDS